MTEVSKVIKRFKSFILGFCACGCGQEIKIRKSKGLLGRFINDHNSRGENHYNYKGIHSNKGGYIFIYSPNHPFKNCKNSVRQHRLIYENYLSIIFDEELIFKSRRKNSSYRW